MRGRDTVLLIGDVGTRRDGGILRTLLGSCVSICLHDPVARVGGMNHFAIPGPASAAAWGPATRFGAPALTALLEAMAAAGAHRAALQAKLFGGARLLAIGAPGADVGACNVAFARAALAELGIPVAAADVGGAQPRQLVFVSDSGLVLVTRLDETRRTAASARAA
jgi:chemotaxis protein CheD